MTADPVALGAFIAYLLVVVGIGVYAAKFSSHGIAEFFVGGRNIHPFVVALSAVVSGRSSWLLLGVTGIAYTRGASAIWAVVGYTTVEMLLFIYYAPRLRRFSERHDCVTLPDFFSERFRSHAGLIRSVLAIVILIFMTLYVSSQFVGGGKAISSSFGLEQNTGVFITAVIVLAYTALGGFLAVSLTDMIQAVFMIIALVLLPVLAFADAGGMRDVLSQLAAVDPTVVDPFAITAGAAIGFVGIGLGSPGNPHIVIRYMSIRDPEGLRYATRVGTVWNVVMSFGAVFIGLVGRHYFPDPAVFPAQDTEHLFPMLAQMHMGPVLFGLVVASIFAAIMSSADSQLLVAASSVVRDLYQRMFRRRDELSPRHLVVASRLCIVALVGASLFLGFKAEQLVFDLVLFAWAGLGAALGPTSVLALYWKRATGPGILAGMVAGAGVTIWWQNSYAFYELIPGFAAGLVATVAASLLTSPLKDVDELFSSMER